MFLDSRDATGVDDCRAGYSTPVNWWLALVLAAAAVPGAAQIGRLRPPDVKYVPTPQSAVDAMLELARVTASDVVYDLGSGDGRIPITAAQKYGARGVGIEIDSYYLRFAFDNLARARVADRVVFLNQDLFESDISPATVVTLFLLPRLNQQLIPKLKRELRPGARVVSHQFDMGDAWPAEQTRDVDGLTIYLWTIR
jgi:cyclopropane fatty-acyl-phospholipid synthase-like methyltransferase